MKENIKTVKNMDKVIISYYFINNEIGTYYYNDGSKY